MLGEGCECAKAERMMGDDDTTPWRRDGAYVWPSGEGKGGEIEAYQYDRAEGKEERLKA